jgi:hypothetical protein
MRRPGVAVQFRGERQAHAAPRPQIRDLLVRKRLNRPVLQTGVWLMVLGKNGAGQEREDQS